MQTVAVLGSTGSIGSNALAVLAQHTDKFRIHTLTAHSDVEKMLAQCKQYQPECVVMVDSKAAQLLKKKLTEKSLSCEVLSGESALNEIAGHADVDTVIIGIVGAISLAPTLSAAKVGKRILFANKEALVMAGDLLLEAVQQHNAQLIPVDSEHNAIFQCLSNDMQQSVVQGRGVGNDLSIRQLWLTASGGPFLNSPLSDLKKITPEQACAHPNWKMGKKISVDCATMVNKGLELIEAHYLFQLPANNIDILIHPQSIIHSCVEYQDGSWLAQMGQHDMKIPITYALAWPHRIALDVPRLNLTKVAHFDFLPLDERRFPTVKLVKTTVNEGGTAPAILNAANEVAVEAFLQNRIEFLQITEIVSQTLEKMEIHHQSELDTILQADQTARKIAGYHILKAC